MYYGVFFLFYLSVILLVANFFLNVIAQEVRVWAQLSYSRSH